MLKKIKIAFGFFCRILYEVLVGRYEVGRYEVPEESSFQLQTSIETDEPCSSAETAYIAAALPLPLLVRNGTSRQTARAASSVFWYDILPAVRSARGPPH